ncbi:hypothetical protein ACU686_40425 [Yinghuangia aomiensis]
MTADQIEEERMSRLYDRAELLGLPAGAAHQALRMAQAGHEYVEHPTPERDIDAALGQLQAMSAVVRPAE